MNKILFSLIFIFLLLESCNKNDKSTESYKQYNITILLDLSDRIEPSIYPNQVNNDIAIISNIVNIFKQKINSKGTINSLDKINVVFYPKPTNSEVNSIAENLSIDLNNLRPKDKKKIFLNIDSVYKENLINLYQFSIKPENYSGSDIWRFFKDELSDKFINNDTNYLNYVFILTDGYLYWEYTKFNEKNRFSYITPTSEQLIRFRKNPDWVKEFDANDYGFININKDYSNLKVMVLEVNPVQRFPEDFDILKKYWLKWFYEMNISKDNIKILKTDFPINTNKIINDFIK